jgi:hypothetical protein
MCVAMFFIGNPSETNSTMTLAMQCDGDDDSAPKHRPTNWLDMKKAEKARNCTRPAHHDKLRAELDSYLAEPFIEENVNSYSWWRDNQLKYPAVAVVARAHLGIPATSVASERVFSKCGRVCAERRSLLSPQHVQQLVFLSKNMPDTN